MIERIEILQITSGMKIISLIEMIKLNYKDRAEFELIMVAKFPHTPFCPFHPRLPRQWLQIEPKSSSRPFQTFTPTEITSIRVNLLIWFVSLLVLHIADSRNIFVFVLVPLTTDELYELWIPAVPDWRTRSKLGEHGEHAKALQFRCSPVLHLKCSFVLQMWSSSSNVLRISKRDVLWISNWDVLRFSNYGI